jgi:FAD/FMN-containing dehydrogenase
VRYAIENSLPFLTVNGGHGMTETLNRFKGGLGISMKRMKLLELNEDNKTAQMGAGLISGEVIRKLGKLDKRTGMTVCGQASF